MTRHIARPRYIVHYDWKAIRFIVPPKLWGKQLGDVTKGKELI